MKKKFGYLVVVGVYGNDGRIRLARFDPELEKKFNNIVLVSEAKALK